MEYIILITAGLFSLWILYNSFRRGIKNDKCANCPLKNNCSTLDVNKK